METASEMGGVCRVRTAREPETCALGTSMIAVLMDWLWSDVGTTVHFCEEWRGVSLVIVATVTFETATVRLPVTWMASEISMSAPVAEIEAVGPMVILSHWMSWTEAHDRSAETLFR